MEGTVYIPVTATLGVPMPAQKALSVSWSQKYLPTLQRERAGHF